MIFGTELDETGELFEVLLAEKRSNQCRALAQLDKFAQQPTSAETNLINRK